MSLTLAISNTDRLDNGAPAEFVLNRRGAMIGRSPTCDWSLPDARNYISSRHCEVAYRDGFYFVTDVSTNGTFLNGAGDRMGEPHRVADGDRFLIGQYEVVAHLTGEAAAAVDREREAVVEAQQASEWGGWDAYGGNAPLTTAETGWDPARPANGPGLGSHAAPLAGDARWAADGSGGWAPAPAPAADRSGWGSPPPAGDDGGWAAPSPAGADGWSAPPADAVSGSGAWAPRLGTPLAREADHLAHGRAAAGHGGASPSPGGPSGWGAPAAPVVPTGGPDGWAAPPGPSTWEAPAPPAPEASGWSSAMPDRPPPPSTNDVWGALAAGNVVDWAQSGFGQPLEERRDPLGLNKAAPAAPRTTPVDSPPRPPAPPAADTGWASPPPPPAAAPRPGGPADRTYLPVDATVPPMTAAAADHAEAFAAAAGLRPGQLKAPSAATLDRAGQLLRRLVGGLVVMVEARARAKSQMGAEATSLSFDGNNPIKFARTPEQAVAQLLNPVERGFMDADKAIDDAFFDLQSHQMATLKAMQGALRATLDRFSPTAIRARAEQRGLFRRIMPGAREAALWQAYEREFSGVAQGSDEAFMDTFAKEFRRAYEEQSRGRKR